MVFSYNNKVINCIPAIDGNNAAVTSTIVNLKGYDHATFVLSFGVVHASSEAITGTGSESNLIAYKGLDVTTCATAFACKYRACTSGDTFGALTDLATTGVSLGNGATVDICADNAMILVEIDAADLAPTLALPYQTVKIGFRFSANSILLSAICVLSKARYSKSLMPTAITL